MRLIKEMYHPNVEKKGEAQNIKVLNDFGIFEEYRPSRYENTDFVHMTSYFYVCSIDKNLGEPNLEDYEIKNGTVAKWINIHSAIKHNKDIISSKDEKMGLSIERETYVLDLILKELIEKEN